MIKLTQDNENDTDNMKWHDENDIEDEKGT